jgi:plasmid maintenance system antidote protein VapI
MKQIKSKINRNWQKELEDIKLYFDELESLVIQNSKAEVTPISQDSIPKSTPKTRLQLLIKNTLVKERLSMTALADKLKIKRSKFSSIIYGKRRNKNAEIKIASYLGEDPEKLCFPLISEKHRAVIYKLIKERGIELNDISREVGLQRCSISEILNGTMRSYAAEDRIAKYFGKKHDDIFPPKDQIYYLLPKESAFSMPENRPDWHKFFTYLQGYVEGMENVFPNK